MTTALKLARHIPDEWKQHASALAAWVDANLVNRRDAFGHYLAVERRTPEKTAVTDKSGLTPAVLRRHFEARSEADLVGLHSTARDGAIADGEAAACWCRWLGTDIDRHDETVDAEATARAAKTWSLKGSGLGFRPLLLDSNGDGGYHLLLLFDGPVASEKVYAFGKWFVRDWKELGLGEEPEIFPKQAKLEGKGFGNWLRLPGRHHTRDHFTQGLGRRGVARRHGGHQGDRRHEGQPGRVHTGRGPHPPEVAAGAEGASQPGRLREGRCARGRGPRLPRPGHGLPGMARDRHGPDPARPRRPQPLGIAGRPGAISIGRASATGSGDRSARAAGRSGRSSTMPRPGGSSSRSPSSGPAGARESRRRDMRHPTPAIGGMDGRKLRRPGPRPGASPLGICRRSSSRPTNSG